MAVDAARYDSNGGLIPTGAHIYYTMPGANSIGIANLDGTGINQSFITGAAKPWGIAVDAGGSTQTSLNCQIAEVYAWDCTATVTTHARMKPRGTLTFTAPGGSLSASSCTLPASTVAVPGTSASCQFRYSLSSAASGTYTLTAAYRGDGLNAASSTSTPFTIERPLLTNVTQTSSNWREGNAQPHTASAKPPVGTTFGFTLKRAARVWFLFSYRTTGRRVGSRCVPQTNANRGRARCLLTVRAAFSRQAHAGRTRLHFEGRLDRTRKLPPGRYRLIIIATANRHWSKPAILRFTILP